MDGNNFVAPADTMQKNVADCTTYFAPRQFAAPPTTAFNYSCNLQFDGQQPFSMSPSSNCYPLQPGVLPYFPFVGNFAPPLFDGHQWRILPKPANVLHPHQRRRHRRKLEMDEANKINSSQPGGDCDYGNVASRNSGMPNAAELNDKMHPVQLLHQIFRKEAFVMEYERINDGPFSRVQVTYKVNGRSYVSEATRLKEARRLCAKKVLGDLFPQFRIETDSNIPKPEYDPKRFANKHPVQILFQVFRQEPIEMHCEEEGAAHFAKHVFTFVIRGLKYRAKAETIKEAKRRAAILALNDYFKENGEGFDRQGEGDASFGHQS